MRIHFRKDPVNTIERLKAHNVFHKVVSDGRSKLGSLFYRTILFALVFFILMSSGMVVANVDGQGDVSLEEIRGRMTLAEIEKYYQVPPAFLIERLRLPKDTSVQVPLKELKDRHGFDMGSVRAFVKEYRSEKPLAKTDAAATAGSAGSGMGKAQVAHKQTFPVSLILALHFLFCVIMVLLLRKNRVNKNVRLAAPALALLIFGILFEAQTEPLRGLVQFFQAVGMGRYGIIDTLMVLGAFILMTLIGVKLVCGWGCPVGALQEMLYHLPVFSGIKKKRTPFWLSNSIRIILFLIFLILLFGWIPGLQEQSIYRFINPFKLFEWDFRMTTPIIIAVILVPSIFYYRGYCQWVCPFGLLSWLIQDLSIFRVRVNRATCINCGKCVRACPTNAAKDIYEGKRIKVDCFSCSRCLTVCPNGSLQYRISRSGPEGGKKNFTYTIK